MKFNVEELKQFRKDLDQTLKALSEKYEIDITLGKIQVIDDMFSIRLNAEHSIKKNVIKPEVKKVAKVVPAKKKLDDLNDTDLNNLDISSLDLDDIGDDTKKPLQIKNVEKEEPKKVSTKQNDKPKDIKTISNNELNSLDLNSLDLDSLDLDDDVKESTKEEPKKVSTKQNDKPKDIKTISNNELNSLDLNSLDLDSLDLDDDVKESTKEEPKKEEPKKEEFNSKFNKNEQSLKHKKKIEDLTDEELENLDLDEIDFGDEEEKPKKVVKTKVVEDDDSRFDQELERYLAPKVKTKNAGPKNVFEEKEFYSNDSDISEEEIDEYIKSNNLFNYSFQAKIIQAEPKVQDFYTDVKNLLLSNEGVKSKVLWDYDDFVYNKKSIAKLEVVNDTLNVYLALDPIDYEDSTYNVVKVNDPKYQGTKLKVEIRDINDEDQLYDLIGDLAEAFDIMPGDDRYDDYHFQYETDDELIERGLIKEN